MLLYNGNSLAQSPHLCSAQGERGEDEGPPGWQCCWLSRQCTVSTCWRHHYHPAQTRVHKATKSAVGEAVSRRKLKKQKGGKQHGDAQGAKQGLRGGKHDSVFILEQPKLDVEAADEGLHVLAQTGKC